MSGDTLRFRWKDCASSQSPSSTWSHALGGISLEVRGGDERHREFADPFRRSESPWSATGYPMARLFHDRLSGPEAVGVSRRILRLGCDIEVWIGLPSFTLSPPPARTDGSPLSLADRSAPHGAYRYMDWLLTVPMPVTEIVLAMELTSAEAPNTRSKLGAASANTAMRRG